VKKTGEHGDTPHTSFPRRRESSSVASVLYINVQEVPVASVLYINVQEVPI